MKCGILLLFTLMTASPALSNVSGLSIIGEFYIRPEISDLELAIKRYAKDTKTILEKNDPKVFNSFFLFSVQNNLLTPYSTPSFFQFLTVSTAADYNAIIGEPEHSEQLEALYNNLFDSELTYFTQAKNFFTFTPTQLQPRTAYDFIGYPTNWKTGHAKGRIIVRKPTDTPSIFLSKAAEAHRFYGQSFRDNYLEGLLVYVNENYIVSIENWSSAEDFKRINRVSSEYRQSHELINNIGILKDEVDVTPKYQYTSLTTDKTTLFRFLSY